MWDVCPQVVEVLEAEMTNNEKILKRALEMAVKFYQLNLTRSCANCVMRCSCEIEVANTEDCEASIYHYFIRKAKEAICKKN